MLKENLLQIPSGSSSYSEQDVTAVTITTACQWLALLPFYSTQFDNQRLFYSRKKNHENKIQLKGTFGKLTYFSILRLKSFVN